MQDSLSPVALSRLTWTADDRRAWEDTYRACLLVAVERDERMREEAVPLAYVCKPAASLDCISGAAHFLRDQWGDYGYRMSIETAGLYSALFGVRHTDGSEFYILADRYGNAYQVEWDGREWARVSTFDNR